MNPMSGSTGIKSGMGRTGSKIPKGYQAGQLQQFTPEQMQLFSQLFGLVGPDSFTSRLAGGDQELFNQIEEPALKQFSELQGGIASRFSGMGGLGARRSSGFQNVQNQAATDFASQLQAQRQGLQRQAIQDLMGMSTSLLSQQPYQNILTPKIQKEKSSGWGGLLGGALGGVGGFLLGGPAGALTGASTGYGIGSQF